MSEKVVLPKFNLPGQGPHPAVRALWVAGGLVVVATLVLSGAMWRHNSLKEEAAAKIVADAKSAAEAKEAKAKSAALAAAQAAAAKKAKQAALPTNTTPAAATTGGEDKDTKTVATRSTRHKSKHQGAKSAKTRTLAKSSASAAQQKKSEARKDDVIDKLLSQYK